MEIVSYAQPLRAIGQALELLNFGSFDMEPVGEDYLIRGNAMVDIQHPPAGPLTETNFHEIWGLRPEEKNVKPLISPIQSNKTATHLDLRYTPKDLERLEKEGQKRRINAGRVADAGSLSQLLRTIGAYLSQKRARLIRLSRDENSFSVEYETSSGEKREELLGAADFYDLWVRMYMKRADRKAN